MFMSMISVRVDKELKKEMDANKNINWSEVIRQAIISTLQKEHEKNMAKAVLLNEKVRKKAPVGYDSTDVIRKFRETRYGPNE
jgi:Arc/MetJ-type ribon-helix-helix transcriptional regulator